MQFEHPSYLWFLVVIPLYFLANQWIKKENEQKMAQMGNLLAIKKLLVHFDEKSFFIKQILISLALFFLIIALANPLWGLKNEEVKVTQTDVIIALDISQSMLCEDIKPSRLEKAKQFATQFIENIKAERIGIVVFAGESYVQMPLTTDYNAASFFIQSATTDLAATQGTAINAAIDEVIKMRNGSKKPCALLLLTDGEDHEESDSDAIEDAKNQGITPYIVGIGTSEGGFIPIKNGAFEIAKKDESGNPIRTKMNKDALQKLANEGNGEYLDIASTSEIDMKKWKEKIISTGSESNKINTYKDKESQYQWFLGISLLLFLGASFRFSFT